ncbi:MAG: peptidoglycan bridge formation glycyltransferase FemA/FemB family protein [Caldilineales bacterium]|nr:peptidoglycan bridge formation glycyltransferase FemA/FemB family protein [Caldilineales bacterium]
MQPISVHEIDPVLLSLPRPHILQTSHWAALKSPVWAGQHYVWGEPEQPDAVVTVLTRRLGRLPLRIQYAPKGPIAVSSIDIWDSVLDHLQGLARRSGAVFIKIDPDVDAESEFGRELVGVLQTRGWMPSAEQVQFRNTVLSDLAANEEVILAGMKQKTRYNIRLAERKGVRVQPSDNFAAFYSLYAETSARDGFLIRPASYYRAVMERMQGNSAGQLFLADVDGDVIAGIFLMRFGPTAWYFYGASADRHRNLMPTYLLQWEAMRWAKGQGCTIYDWWGAPDELVEDDPMWGVYRFKEGFGGRFTRWIGAWDYAPRPALYRTYTQAMPRVLDAMRRRHRSATEAGG